MGKFNLGLCAALFLFALLGVEQSSGTPLLGAKECTWGPSYWCSNLTNAKGCNAVRHCIQTVWESQAVPEDNDSICKICKDMVTQARDQLRSNETMEELKEVFEGSCKLIPIKIVNKECCKLADDFIPELVEALSSQMNPDQVCSVAGLCNNAEIDKLLAAYYSQALSGTLGSEEKHVEEKPKAVQKPTGPRQLSCGNCHSVSSLIADKFSASNRDDVLENVLHLCGSMSSFSDACASIAITYFNDIYDHLKVHLNADGLCHLTGVCAGMYHQHPEDSAAVVESQALATDVQGDDIPCELCQQLVHHLRDLLVANTTEVEFKQVLEGLCKQTQGFKSECLSIVDQYYDVIYHTLVNDLDANGACFLIGVCPKGESTLFDHGIMPLLPVLPPADIQISIKKKLGGDEPAFSKQEIDQMTLPIDHLMGAANPELYLENAQLCTLCEYALHFVQEELATPATEEQVKKDIEAVCNKMPKSIRGKCDDFVEMYGDAIVALIIQGLDPKGVCPRMMLCPQSDNKDDVEVFAPETVDSSGDKPTCPLCLFAVEQAQEKIKTDKSKENIKNVLNNLCSHLPAKLSGECVDFVKTYSNELIDMLIADFKAQEICVSLKLCTKTSNWYLIEMGISVEDDSSSEESPMIQPRDQSNELFDENGLPIEITFATNDESAAPNCLLCEEVVKLAEKRIGKHATKEDIKKTLEESCDRLRSNLRAKCHKYMDRYGDKIASLLLKQIEPKVICTEIGLCLFSEMEDLVIDEALKYDVVVPAGNPIDEQQKSAPLMQDPPTCVLCEFVMTKLEADLRNKTTQDDIKRAVQNVCNHMPKTVAKSCVKFVNQYGDMVITLIDSVPPKEVCQKMQLCMAPAAVTITDDIIECGVCHGASMALNSYMKEQNDLTSVAVRDMVDVACETLPAKYFAICSDMISTYGQSIIHLYQRNANDVNVCSSIGKCFANEKSGLAFAHLTA